MIKYVLKILAGADPAKVIGNMPPKDFEKLSSFVANIGGSGLPRNQKRMIERKWNKVYGKKETPNR